MEKRIAFSFEPQKINFSTKEENIMSYNSKKENAMDYNSKKENVIDYNLKKENAMSYNLKEVVALSSSSNLEKRVSLLEKTTVPKKLSLLPDVDSTSNRASILLYADDNGKSCKISIKDMLSKQIRTSSVIPDDLQEGEYIFLELKEKE